MTLKTSQELDGKITAVKTREDKGKVLALKTKGKGRQGEILEDKVKRA